MLRIPVKICGLSDANAVAAALAGGASQLGFIFFDPSPRNVEPRLAGELRLPARNRALAVAVVVDATDERLDAIMREMQPDMLQLHGKESPERVARVKERYGLPVMKALSIRDAQDLEQIADHAGMADRLLLDARAPADAEIPGGNGLAFDWNLLDALDPGIDFMLSGGISLRNLEQALHHARSGGIDISSGVETAPGRKDPALITRMLEAIRAFEKMEQAS